MTLTEKIRECKKLYKKALEDEDSYLASFWNKALKAHEFNLAKKNEAPQGELEAKEEARDLARKEYDSEAVEYDKRFSKGYNPFKKEKESCVK